jgi:hypothetical protein
MESSYVALLLGDLFARLLQAFRHDIVVVIEGVEDLTFCSEFILIRSLSEISAHRL